MLGSKEIGETKLNTFRRVGVCLGMLCGVLAMASLNMGGCIFPPAPNPCETDVDCDDDNGCTGDVCDVASGDCSNTELCGEEHCLTVSNADGQEVSACVECIADDECDDDDVCTGDETCVTGACVDGTALDCDDADACTDDLCDATDGCVHTVVVCAVGEECVDGVCITPCNEDADCDDADFCNGTELCIDGACAAGADPCPDDGVFCNGTESCDLATDTCESSGDPCTADGLQCDEAAGACTEGTACTTDADCPSDDLFCTGVESCNTTTGFCETTIPCTAEQTCNEALNTCVNPPGETISFTLSTDVSPATDGTAGDDTYSAPLLFNAPTGGSVPSLQTGDNANGGDGTDRIDAQFNFTAGGGTTVAATLTAIETINVTDFGTTGATTLSGTNITGATAFNLSGSTNTVAFVVTNLPNLVNLGIAQQGVGATLGFQSAASSGSADAATMTFNGMTGGTVTYTSGTTNGLETLNLVSNTTASTVADIAMNGTTLTTVNVSGDAAFTHTASLDSNVTTVNASTATGAVTFTQTNAGAFTFTGGAGDDSIILGATYGTTDTINGGAGTGDRLGGTTAVIAGTSATQSNVTNIEKLRVSDELVGTVNLSHWGTIAEVVLDDGANVGIISNAATGFKVSSGLRGGAVCVGTSTLVVTVSGSATTDTATYTLNDCEQAGAVTFNGVETLNLESNLDLDGSAADSGTAGQNTLTSTLILTDTAAVEKVVVTGTEQLNLTGAVTANQLDASGFTQPLIMGTDMALAGVTVTGGSGADTLFGSAGNDIIDGGAAADIIDAGDGQDIITGGASADTFRFTAGDLSAAPSDTIFDTITDFAKNSDIFDESAGALVIMPSATAAVAGTALINAEGIATFAAADDTLAERVIATEAGINLGGAAAVRQFAVFEHSTNSYLFVSDGTDGIAATDMLFQMTGVTGLSDTTLTAGDLTIN